MRAVTGLTALVVSAGFIGCQNGADAVRSDLSGTWRVVQGSITHVRSDGSQNVEELDENEDQFITIRPDGSFDLSNTLLAYYAPLALLKRTGDRVRFMDPFDPTGWRGEVKLTRTRYTQQASESVLLVCGNKRNRTFCISYKAKMTNDGTVCYRNEFEAPDGAQNTIVAKLERCE